MFLFLNRRHVVFINIFVFYISFSSSSGEYEMRGINELPDGFKINTEEIQRRRKLVEPYLLQIAEKQRGWLETNHMSLSSDALPSMPEAVSDSQIVGKYPVHGEFPSTESIKKTPVQNNSKKDKIKTQQLNVHNNKQKSTNTEERAYRHAIVENFIPELKALEMGIGIDQASPKRLIYDGNESNTEKLLESSDEAVSEAQFSHETEISDLPSTAERMSKAVNVVEGTDTRFNVEENDRPSGISVIDHDYCVVGDMKESFLHIIKKQTKSRDNDLTRYKDPLMEKFKKNNSEANDQIVKSTAENNIQHEFKKNAGATVKLYSVSEKHLEKKKLVEPFLSSLNQGKNDWVETYHFNYKETHTGVIHRTYFMPNDRDVVQNIPGGQIQERLFFQRWLKKLLNKLVDYPLTENITISFYVTTDSLSDLKMLSESGNIKNADELICGLISNANVHYGYNISNLFNSYSSVTLYIIISIMVCVLLYFFLLCYPRARILFALLACIIWHGFKMYQEKVAEKHATVSGSSPAYCESILNKESGIFAHIKELIRHTAYKDHCEKYYEALMINPLAELSVSIVISDFVSSTFFQVFRPMGRMFNTLVKDLFRDLSFVQAFYLIILLIIICALFVMFTLVYNRYKLNLPFFMGSAEPCLAPGGSRVEDVTVKLNIIEDSPLKLTLSKNNDLSILDHKKYSDLPSIHHKEYNVSLKSSQNDCDYKISKLLARRYSF